MDDLKSVTVSYLRDLARKHLGPGYSKLNKTELIAALANVVPTLKKLAELAGIAVAPGAKPADRSAVAAGKAAPEARGGVKKPERKQESEKKLPEQKRELERKKEPEGKKVAEKKNPEGRKGSKKGPEAKKAVEKKAPEKKAAPPPRQKVAPPQKKATSPGPKAAAQPEPKKATLPPEPKKATPPPEQKPAQPEQKAAPAKPKATPSAEPKAAAQPEQKAAPPKDRKPMSGRSAAARAEELAQSLRPAQVVNFPPRQRSYRSAEDSWNEDTAETAAERPAATASHPAEPLLEGFFVARVMGERELRRHHLTEDQQAPRAVTSNGTGYEENLGELPVDYESDVATALARDPHTLFVSWDFTPATRARAMEGLDSPRPVLRVYEGDKLVRVEEFALESRSFYIHGLPPGRSYRVEAHFVGRDGRSRRIGSSTHPVRLPQAGLSQDTAVRFMRMPPPPPPTVRAVAQQPLAAPPEPPRQSVVDEGEFITWHRVPLPSSADVAMVLESRRERIQRQPAAAPGAPGPARPAHLQVSARPLGASELAAARGLRLGGASELAGAAGRGQGGASEQTHWTPPPSGRGR
jgi:hypothetical protein